MNEPRTSPETRTVELPTAYRRVLYYELNGESNGAELARLTGYSPQRVWSIRNLPEYKEVLAQLQREVDERVVQGAADLGRRFNKESVEAAEKIFSLRDTAKKEEVQLAASKEILDRAPDAPKSHKVVDQNVRGFILQVTDKVAERLIGAMSPYEKELGGARGLNAMREKAREVIDVGAPVGEKEGGGKETILVSPDATDEGDIYDDWFDEREIGESESEEEEREGES